MYEINCYDSYGNTIDYLTQWDYNRKLIMYIDNYDLLYAPEVHFCNQNSAEALVVQSSVEDNKVFVDIPNILLQENLPLFAYVYLSDANNANSQKTIFSVTLPVRYRPKPSEYTYVENIDKVTSAQIEQTIFDRLKDRLLMIESAEQTKIGDENNGVNVFTITLTDGTVSEFKVRDGVDSVYIGSGDMPDGYNFQIDPDGDDDGVIDGVIWNQKSNFSGYYKDLRDKPEIPTRTSQLYNDSGFLKNSDIEDKGYLLSDTFDKYTLSESKIMSGIKRKLLSMTGGIAENRKGLIAQKNRSRCYVYAVNENSIDLYVNAKPFQRMIRIYTTEGTMYSYEVVRLSGYGINRGSVYSATNKMTTRRLLEFNIDGKRYINDGTNYTNLDLLRTVDFKFEYLAYTYSVSTTEGKEVGVVTTILTADNLSICETITDAYKTYLNTDLVDGVIKDDNDNVIGNYVKKIAQHGNNILVFSMNDGNIYYTEKIEKIDDNTVIKNFNFKGGF